MNKSVSKKNLNPLLVKAAERTESDSECSSNSDDNNLKKINSGNANSCKCHEKYVKIKNSSMKHVIVSRGSYWDVDELSMKRQKLEMQLSNCQIEESINIDKHMILERKFERMENIISAFLFLLDSIELEQKASYRMCQQLNGLVVNENSVVVTEELSDLVKHLCSANSIHNPNIVREKLKNALELKKDFENLIIDYNDKKVNFTTASQNFKLLIQSTSLSLAQLEKLQRQFDSILLDFQHSRCMLDQELPIAIANQTEVLLNSFGELATDLQKIASQRTDLSSLLKHLEMCLRNCNDLLVFRLCSFRVKYGIMWTGTEMYLDSESESDSEMETVIVHENNFN
ncbi:hypothetical protein FQA39_LY04975 [Lamprigera yunnana]|nr:hypothetical protein FQA39_LY04975 [Lamprigera yunnana]